MNRFIVVIVTCNRLELLKECIECAKNQKTTPEKIIIVNNNSTDGTRDFLEREIVQEKRFCCIHEPKNVGGAGGFADGIRQALKETGEWIALIDDDAMLDYEYLFQISEAIDRHPNSRAFTGSVMAEGKIDVLHRRRLKKKKSIKLTNVPIEEYKKREFFLDAASFCGLVVKKDIVKEIGLPEENFFIWNDDLEYSLRIRELTNIVNANHAILNHKTNLYNQRESKRYLWKDYYGFRNFYYTCRKHGYLKDCMFAYLKERIRLIYWRLKKKVDQEEYDYNLKMICMAWKHAKEGKLGICNKYVPG